MGISLRLGDVLRSLRRRLDASQRELAQVAGVGKSTVARVETGSDISVRALERMLAFAGWRLAIVDRDGVVIVDPGGLGLIEDDAEVSLRDAAGRRYPAHLDVRNCVRAGDWWFNAYNTDGRPTPSHTFDLARWIRDDRRDRDALFPADAAGQPWPRRWRRRWKPRSKPPRPDCVTMPRPPEHPGPPIGPGWALGVSPQLDPNRRWT